MDYKIKVSVIIPVYNVEEYLEECLESAINQTLKDIEIICVDDASTDESSAILQKYIEKCKNLKVIRQPHNMGLASARNTGRKPACGKYIYFLDSDDWIEPDTLERLYTKAEENNLDMVFFNTEVFGSDVDKVQIELYKKYYRRSHYYPGNNTGISLFASMHSRGEYLSSACLYMAQRKFLEEQNLSFMEGIIHEDELYTFQSIIKAERCGYLEEKFYHRRLRPASIVTKKKTFDNVKGILFGAWKGAENLTGTYDEGLRKEITSFFMKKSRYAMTIYRGLDCKEQSRIKELPFPDQLRFREMLSAMEIQQPVKAQQGMLVYGAGAHLADMLSWHSDLAKRIVRVFDKDPGKIGLKVQGLEIVIESPEALKSMPKGTQIAVSAIRYYDEIVQELHELNPGLICPDIDEAYERVKNTPVKDVPAKATKTIVRSDLTNLQRLRLKGRDAQARWRQNLLLSSAGCRHVFWGTRGVRATYLRRLLSPLFRQGDFFVDEDLSLRGQMVDGLPICVPEILKDMNEKFLIVIMSENYEQIRLRLADYGYVENVDFVEGRRLVGEDENGYINVPCIDKSTEGMIAYGLGAHLEDMLNWHPELARHIKRVIDKDKQKMGQLVPKVGVPVEHVSVLRYLPAGTEIAIAAIKYIGEIEREIRNINPGLICKNIDGIWQEYV